MSFRSHLSSARLVGAGLVATLILLGASDSSARSKAILPKKIEVTWLGHAAFEVVSPGGTRILIDPFLSQNPKTPARFKKLSQFKPDAVLVTHSHGDHVGDALIIAKQSKALLVGAADHVRAMKEVPKELLRGGNVGGTFQIKDVTVHLVPAMHGSSPGGRPVGFVLTFNDGRSIYHSGDTWIFGDMALIQELYAPEILLLQTGGGPYNQAPDVAALAVKKYFSPKTIVPMHFATFGVLATAAEVDAAFAGDKRYVRMAPGETRKF